MHALIQDVRTLLEEAIKERTFISCIPSLQKTKVLSQPACNLGSDFSAGSTVEPTLPLEPQIEPFAPPIVHTNLDQEPISPPIDPMKARIQRLLAAQFQEEPPPFFYFVTCVAKNMPFLKKLAEATHNAIVPAKAYLLKQEDLLSITNNPHCKLVIACCEEVLAQTEAKHKLIYKDKCAFFLLENPAAYANNSTLKKDLWTALKALPLSNLLK